MTEKPDNQAIISELARAKAVFQQRTIVAILNDTPAPNSPPPDRAGGIEAHAAAVTSDVGDNGSTRVRRESMGTAHIDTESPDGSWAAILPYCQQIKQSDFPVHASTLADKGK